MAEVASAYVPLIPSAKGFGSKIQSQIGGDVDRVGKSSGKRFGGGLASGVGSVAGKVFAPLAAAGAALAVGSFLKDAVGEARESQKVGAITAQVIKTTGGAAKVTAGQVGELATAISNKTGIDDEAIQSASNLLLTFTNLRNEVGKGNDVFNQATQIATDMGAALGTEPKAAAIQLGKALNDPVKGVSALQRVGVSFTAQQKKTIKSLVDQGNTLGAQKIILRELKKEFGGTAAASATAGEKAKVAWGNFKESIGTALLPTIDRLATFFTEKIVPALQIFFDALTGNSELNEFDGALKKVNNAGVRLFEAGRKLSGWVKKSLIPALKEAGHKILPSLKLALDLVRGSTSKGHVSWKQIGDIVINKVIPALTTIAQVVLPVLGAIIHNSIMQWKLLAKSIQLIWSVARPVFMFVTRAFLTLVGAIINGAADAFGWVPGLGPKLKNAAEKFNEFRNRVNNALNGIQTVKSIRVMTPGAREANRQLAELLYKTQHLPKSVTIGVTNKLHNIPGRASGGPVRAGQPYIVGEHRPELFVPSQSGRIIPDVPGGVGGRGSVRLHPHDIALLADAIASRPTVLDGVQVSKSQDHALAMGVRL